MAKPSLKPVPVMVLPQRGPKIIASTARVYSPGYALRLGIDLITQALPGQVPPQSMEWALFIIKEKKEIHLMYVPNVNKSEHPMHVKSWRNGPTAKSIMVNIGPALRALGISAWDAIGTYVAQASKHKIVITMGKKI